MGLMSGKKGVIFGVANKFSIAWGITQALAEEGAQIGLTWGFPDLERRVRPLAEEVNADLFGMCNLSKDEDIEATFQRIKEQYGQIDFLVHAVAFANREDLDGEFVNTSRAGFATAMDVSVYTLVALARAARPLMKPGGSITTMTYHGSTKVIPNYNVMGVAKAALEASVRYLANDLGPEGIRVNAISAGPIKTLSASGIAGFRSMLGQVAADAPMRRNITQEDVGDLARFLCSDRAVNITGQVMYIDAGHSILGAGSMAKAQPKEEQQNQPAS